MELSENILSFLRDKFKLLQLCFFYGKKETQKCSNINLFFVKVEFLA